MPSPRPPRVSGRTQPPGLVKQPTSAQPPWTSTWTHAVIWTWTSFGQYSAAAAAWTYSKSSPTTWLGVTAYREHASLAARLGTTPTAKAAAAASTSATISARWEE
jgi:hypothetical protein